MSMYVIGDVHGCYEELKKLFITLKFDIRYDKAIFVGDLVGRGPKSLEVLDFVMDFGDSSINVLGNHDLNLIAMAYELLPIANDIKEILRSPNLDKYITWLSSCKLMYLDTDSNIAVTHAGVPPAWNLLTSAKKYANFFESYMTTHGPKRTLEIIHAAQSLNWQDNMTEEKILQYTIFGFTKIKFCYDNGDFDTEYQCAPGQQPSYLTPWFLLRDEELNDNYNIIFGHWASLGLYQGQSVTCCDTGCVWNEKLTAIEINKNRKIYQINSSYKA